MNPNINSVTSAWLKYQAEKKRSGLVTELVTPTSARTMSQRASQEINVLERNLAVYRAVSRRARPSMNARVSKKVKKDITAAIAIAEKYLADYTKTFTAWKKLVKSPPKERKVPIFPLKSVHGSGVADALNRYFQQTIAWIEGETIRPGNVPVLAHKYSDVNIRGKTISEAKTIKSASARLKMATKRANAVSSDLDRARYDLTTAANATTRSTQKWKRAQTKLRQASEDVRAMRQAHAEDVASLVWSIEDLLAKQARAKRQVEKLQLNVTRYRDAAAIMKHELNARNRARLVKNARMIVA